jgi:hypothetical protein
MSIRTKVIAPTRDVKTLLEPEDAEDVAMLIDPEAMKHVVDRLTELYPDPVVSLCREVCSNALDATLLLPPAERKPVKVSTPSNFTPQFVVEDFGIGMAPDVVRTIYSQYGSSTKRDNMDQTGAYGLGAKAPLAYTPEYFMETTSAGVTTSVAILRKALGNITRILSIQETGRPSGTKITIPAEVKDVERFRTALANYRNYSFDTPFEVDGVVSSPDKEYVEFDSVTIFESDTEKLQGRVWVHRKQLSKLFREHGRSDLSFTYLLSGWSYSDPESWRGDGARDVLVELKPGVVDFSSSRDAVTKNDRSSTLHKRVYEQLNSTEYLFSNVIRHFRSLTLAEAIEFLRSLQVSYVAKEGKLTALHRKPELSYAFDEFLLESGEDPFAELAKVGELEAYAVANFVRDGGLIPYSRSADNNLLASHVERMKRTRGYDFPKVAESNAKIEELSAAAPQISITAFLKSIPDDAPAEVVYLITGADAEQLPKVLRQRSLFLKSLSEKRNVFAVFTTRGAFSAEEVETLQTYTTLIVKQITADEFRAQAASARTVTERVNLGVLDPAYKFELRKLTVPAGTSLPELLRVLDGGRGTFAKDLIDARRPTRGEAVELSLIEVLQEKAILTLGVTGGFSKQLANVLRGAINAGKLSEATTIYDIPASVADQLRDVHLRMLVDYDRLFVHNWTYNSIAGGKIRASRRFFATMTEEELRALPVSEVMAGLLGSVSYWQRDPLKNLVTVLSEAVPPAEQKHFERVEEAFDASRRGNFTLVEADLLEKFSTLHPEVPVLQRVMKLNEKIQDEKGALSAADFTFVQVAIKHLGESGMKKSSYYKLVKKDVLRLYRRLEAKQQAPAPQQSA